MIAQAINKPASANNSAGTLTDEYLLGRHLPPAMERYFIKKLPDLDRHELLVRIAECIKGLMLMSSGSILFSNEIDTIWSSGSAWADGLGCLQRE